ncbi:MAG: response regulator [Candidatus Omnitrophica bacterium]|nr:response regulator [Candidatus Omnitrophota bacterium]MBU4473019.1 response regulator [Candidatus Omnitrophota bacterium]MCG2706142.1 response regulator [Candidatus Omnitrophota bacterium]
MIKKILIIDDEPDVLEFQKSYLSRRKYQVTTASNTKEAIETIKNESPDIVFCDIRLETDTAGLDILEQAKKIKPDMVVYLITGLPEVEVEKKGLALGAKELLHKPITNEILEGKIKEAIG